jgi:periplasmic protein TonB
MNVKTLTKIGAVTLASCSAHAALLAALPAHDPSARIKGGSVSVQFANVGSRTGEGRSASPPENADANTAVEPLVEGETVEPEPSGAELTSAEPKPMKEVAEVSAPEAIPKTPPPSYTPATEVHPETLPKDLLATPPERSHESEKPVSPDDAETSQHAMPDGKTAGTAESDVDEIVDGGGGAEDASVSETDSTNQSEIQTEQATSGATGNAAEMNYAGEVMRHLSRVRRPRASSPGSAFVSFTLTADGDIEDVSISQRSGSGRFDHDAINVVKRAAPYPKPPPGVNRTFVVEIEGQ